MRPYLQISFCTNLKALFYGTIFLWIHFVKYWQNVQKLNFDFWRFNICFTSKHKIKQIPFDSPFNFILTLLEWICLKVNTTISTFEKLRTWFAAKGSIRPFSSKTWHSEKKWKPLKLYTYYLWCICNHFSLETCIWKRLFLYPFDPEHQKLMWWYDKA